LMVFSLSEKVNSLHLYSLESLTIEEHPFSVSWEVF
jgi:hypothetical protein